jgi:hypothetical protein
MNNTLDLTADMIDVRDIIARVEELREERDQYEDARDPSQAPVWEQEFSDEAEELATLSAVLTDLAGCGGDEKFEGDWYPGTLIRDSYFQDYAEQLADDIGAINANASWPNNCIDWERATRELQMDYSSVEIDGETYWYR